MSAKRTRANGEGSIFPYRNGYAAYTWVTKPNTTRTRKYVYSKTREAVHDKWLALHRQAKEGPIVTKTPAVGEYVRYWLQEIVAPNLAPGTYVTYEQIARAYIIPGLGPRRLDRLQTRDVQTWLNAVRRTCQCCAQDKDARRRAEKQRCCALGKCCQDLPSPATVTHVRRVLRTVLSQAQTDGLVTRNMAKLVKLPPARKHKRKSWTTDEARRFLESARTDKDPFYAAYALILVLGLRKGEALGVGWEEINLEHGELTVGWQLQRIGKRLLRRQTKTDTSDATLPLPSLCLTALRHRHKDQQVAQRESGAAWQPTPLVFTTRYGTPIEPRNFNRYWDRRCNAAGIRRITVHDARRTCGSLLADLDVHPRVAMQILRHAQFSITMEIYTQISSQATRDALKRLGESLGE
jgi:integrase